MSYFRYACYIRPPAEDGKGRCFVADVKEWKDGDPDVFEVICDNMTEERAIQVTRLLNTQVFFTSYIPVETKKGNTQ